MRIRQGATVPASRLKLVQTEEAFQLQVLRLAWAKGWMAFHCRIAIGSNAGWPDLVLLRGDRLLFRELKREDGRLTDKQAEWLEALHKAGADAKVWKPSDWNDVEQTLA